MLNLRLERAIEYSELSVTIGVKAYFFVLEEADLNEDGTFQFRDETLEFTIGSDEELLSILSKILAKNADRGIVDLYVFFFREKIALLPEFSKVADKALEEIAGIIQTFREFGVKKEEKPKSRRKTK